MAGETIPNAHSQQVRTGVNITGFSARRALRKAFNHKQIPREIISLVFQSQKGSHLSQSCSTMTTLSTVAAAVAATLAAIATNGTPGNRNLCEVGPVGAVVGDGGRSDEASESDTDDIDNEVIDSLARNLGTVSHPKPTLVASKGLFFFPL